MQGEKRSKLFTTKKRTYPRPAKQHRGRRGKCPWPAPAC